MKRTSRGDIDEIGFKSKLIVILRKRRPFHRFEEQAQSERLCLQLVEIQRNEEQLEIYSPW